MLSTVITVLLLVVMVLIIASLVIGALREHRRHMRTLQAAHVPAHSLDSHVTAILHMQDGVVIGIEKPTQAPIFFLPSSWYTRRRTLVSLGFIVMIMLTFFVQADFAGGALQSISQDFNVLSYFQPTDLHTASHPLPDTANTRLVRVDSADRRQYYTDYQWQVWSYSSCSGIAMEMVMNAYGRHLIAADVLQKELDLGVWNVYLGLLREEGIGMTANYFGFMSDATHARTLSDLITISNKGIPIIVSVRDGYYFPGGHIFVVRGGDSQYIYIADSSLANFQRMTHAQFVGMWQGFSAILTPR
jgi:hypothetical protein